MIDLKGYKIGEQIYESSRTLVFRGERTLDKQSVVLKFLKGEYPKQEDLGRRKYEFEMINRIKSDGVIQAFSLHRFQHSLVLVMEDFGGTALKEQLRTHDFDLKGILSIAIQIADSIGQIHNENIIHKDINPSNIVWNPDSDQLKIIDFDLSTRLSRQKASFRAPELLEGTLAYISPEQLGRINRDVDYRTDFYSFGVTLFEMLTGQTPFQSDDSMEIVHLHMAQQPVPPHKINPSIPQAVSDIILKLLAKNAEERYQGAFGLKSDLEFCLKQLMTEDQIDSFPAGQTDVPSRFSISQKLYGRESELERLHEALERAIQGRKEMLLVSGYAGIGKTSLVRGMQHPVLQRQGYYVTGKFDPLHRNIPYSSILYAFMDHILNLLTEKEEAVEKWRNQLQNVLGSIGQVLVEVIPEMELIIGKQSPVPALPPKEEQSRFNRAFQQFIQVFARPEHPLVLFLDDLQWADSASLQLIKLFLTDSDTHNLLIIGAYRDNEVDATHPLMLTLNEIKAEGTTVSDFKLSALAESQVNQLCADTLYCKESVSSPLAKLVFQKTQGNPFFVNSFLQSLYEEKLLTFQISDGRWTWDQSQIEAKEITSNVIDLMISRIETLSNDAKDVIKTAACIGNRFTLGMLSHICGKSGVDTARDLWEGIEKGIIEPVGSEYRLLQDVGTEAGGEEGDSDLLEKIVYEFVHDRIQQAAYSLIPENQRSKDHWNVGRLMMTRVGEDIPEESIFDIVNQLNFGVGEIDQPYEKEQLASLNLTAGTKARESAAYEQSLRYLKTGISLLKEDCWEKQFDLCLALHTEAVNAAFLNTQFEEMDRLADIVLGHTKTPLDQVRVYEAKIGAFQAQNNMTEALNTALQILKQLGVRFPENPTILHATASFMKTALSMLGRKTEDLIHLPWMKDAKMSAVMRILANASSTASKSNPFLFILMVTQVVKITLKYGRAPETSFWLVGYGLTLNAILSGMNALIEVGINAGYKYGQLALEMIEQPESKKVAGRTLMIAKSFMHQWKHHLREIYPSFLDAYKLGLETGDVECVAMSAFMYCNYCYLIGLPLDQVNEEMETYGETLRKLGDKTNLNIHNIFHQAIANLRGKSSEPCQLAGELFNEAEELAELEQNKDFAAVFLVYLNKQMLCYYLGDTIEAIKWSEKAKSHILEVPGHYWLQLNQLYDSLSRVQEYRSANKSQQKKYLKQINNNQAKLIKSANQAPNNHLHKYYLVEAEKAQILGQPAEAMEYYSKSIKGAKENEFLQEEALANELAGQFYLNIGYEKIARVYLQEARYLYNKWGARVKVDDLDAKYAQLNLPLDSANTAVLDRKLSISAGSTSQLLDFSSVQKASRAIAGEFLLDKILKTLMHLVMENAGAEKVILTLKQGDQFFVEAKAALDDPEQTDISLPLDECADLSASIVRYVLRTEKDMVINDSKKESAFARDPYIMENQPKSILCIPIKYHGMVTGVLYMENNQFSGAFTKDRIEVLQVLVSQAAISIENARLYSDLEQRVKDRTADLNSSLKDVEAVNQKVTDSINYARRIQNSMLPAPELLKANFSDSFVLWRPRDIVGGDFYYMDFIDDNIIMAVVDCTGHGVPGAFMSIIAFMELTRIIKEENVHLPNKILKRMNATIKTTLQKDTAYAQSNDGLDASICLIKPGEGVLDYSGTKMSLLYIQDNEPHLVKGDNHSIGDKRSDLTYEFTSHTIPMTEGSAFYLFTDGYVDQTGGSNSMMFGKKRFQKLLLENHQRPFDVQRQILIDTLRNFRGDSDRKDDVTVIGFKV
jgi:predicted ATPase/serine phosphatase RsbU (regulator of sigma subunit)/tRNA A-37 threonylcarbamoyl transferase component Bud32